MLNRLHEERMGVHYLTAFGDGVRFHVYTKRPLENGRLDGFRMRTTPVYDAFFKSLGAESVQIPPPEVYTALERGVADGYGWPIWGIFDFGWQEYTTHVYEPGFYNVMVNLLVNQTRWTSMTDAQRGCLTEMAQKLEADWPAWRDEHTARERTRLDEAGIEVVDLGEGFRDQAHSIYWQELQAASPEIVGELRALLLTE
jgi:TRAP-type C4-dicarboxylate transport system substrate-binding protein